MGKVRVDKDCLRFAERGEGIASSDSLLIENLSNTPITYKMKTTDARRFAVRPNLRVIEAGGVVDITIVYNGKRRRSSRTPHFQLEVASCPEAPSFEPTHFWAARKKASKMGSRRAEDLAASAVKVYKLSFATEFFEESEEETTNNHATNGSAWTAGSRPVIRATAQQYHPPSCLPVDDYEEVAPTPQTRIPTVKPPSAYRKSKSSKSSAKAPSHPPPPPCADDALSDESDAGSPEEEVAAPAPEHPKTPSAYSKQPSAKQPSAKSANKPAALDGDVGSQHAAAVVVVSSHAASATGAGSTSKDKIYVQPMPPNTSVAEAAAAIASRVEADGGAAEVVILSEPKKSASASPSKAASAGHTAAAPTPIHTPATEVHSAGKPHSVEAEMQAPAEKVAEEVETKADGPKVDPYAGTDSELRPEIDTDDRSASVLGAAAVIKEQAEKKEVEAKDLREAADIIEDTKVAEAIKAEQAEKEKEAAVLKEALDIIADTKPDVDTKKAEVPVPEPEAEKVDEVEDQEKKVEEAKKLLEAQEAELDKAKEELEAAQKSEEEKKLADAKALLAVAKEDEAKKKAEAEEAAEKIKEAEKTVEEAEKAMKDEDGEEGDEDKDGEEEEKKDEDEEKGKKKKKAGAAAAAAVAAGKKPTPDDDGSGDSTLSAGNQRISQDSHGSNETGTSHGSGKFDTESDDTDGEEMGKRKRAKRKLKRFGHKIKGGFKKLIPGHHSSDEDEDDGKGSGTEEEKEKRKDRGGPSRRKSRDDDEEEGSETEQNLKKVAQVLAASSEGTPSEDSNAKERGLDSETDDSGDERQEEILATIKELQELVRKRVPSMSSSEASSEDTLHNGTIASTPPNERAQPADDVDSAFETEPTEHSRSDRSEHGGGRSVSVTGSVVSERRPRRKKEPSDSTATSPKRSDPTKEDSAAHSVSTNVAARRRRKRKGAAPVSDDDSDLGGALKSAVFKKGDINTIEPVADEATSKEVRFVGAAAHPHAAPAIPPAAMAAPPTRIAHDYLSTTEEDEPPQPRRERRRARLPQPEELTSDEDDSMRVQRVRRIRGRKKTPRQSPMASPPNEPADGQLPVEDVSSGASELERNKEAELAWLYKRIAETNALIAETKVETAQVKRAKRSKM